MSLESVGHQCISFMVKVIILGNCVIVHPTLQNENGICINNDNVIEVGVFVVSP